MRNLFLLANEIQSFCRDRGWRFCFIGGIALLRTRQQLRLDVGDPGPSPTRERTKPSAASCS